MINKAGTIRALKVERARRLLQIQYRQDPMFWLKQRFGEDPLSYMWSELPEYEGHEWDGDVDPIAQAWLSLAKGDWAALHAATGCHGVGTPVIMYDGSVLPVEDVRVGDSLMGPDSKPRRVLSLARGKQTMYRITPNRGGDPFVCNEDHILSLRKTPTPGKYKSKPDVVNVRLGDYLNWGSHDKHLYKLYRSGYQLPENNLTYDPYFIGLWLGDGHRHTSAITCVEPEIVEYLIKYADSINYRCVRWASKDRANTYSLNRAGLTNDLANFCKSLYYGEEKRVPVSYLTGSTSQRLALLAGLIDSDGCYSKGSFNYATIYEGLKDDVLRLARSLGFSASASFYANDYNGYFVIQINGALDTIPTKLSRKMAGPRLQKKNHLVTGFTVTKLSLGNYYGFELSGDHLYLLGDTTVTHNTSKTYSLARVVFWFLDCFKDSLVVTSAPKEAQLKLHLWAEISKSFYKFKRIRPYAELLTLRLVVDSRKVSLDEEADLSKSWQAVGFIAGVAADEDSATKAQGFHREHMLIITEETPGMPLPIMTAFQNTSTGGHNLIFALGNPDSEHDTLGQFCNLANVRDYRISAYDYPNVVLGKEIIPGAVTQKSIDWRKAHYGEESSLYISRVRGLFPAEAEDSLIKGVWFDQCCTHERIPKDLIDVYSYNAVGVDVANSMNGDKAALAWGKGYYLLKLNEFQCKNATHLAYNLFMGGLELKSKGYDNYNTSKLADYAVSGQMIGVDGVGVGAATVNALADNHLNCYSLVGGQLDKAIPLDKDTKKPLYKFKNLRAQMYWEAREDLRLGRVRIQLTDQRQVAALRKELCIPKYKFTDRDIAIEGKEHIKKRMGGKSPNLADAFVYWNWVRKAYHVTTGALPMFGGN